MPPSKIPFNRPCITGDETALIAHALESSCISGNSTYSRLCEQWFVDNVGCRSAHVTPSCTAALEMACLLIDLKEGDEVIMPSFTFVSTANAVVLQGAKPVFVDIEPQTLCMDIDCVKAAVTPSTKAIMPVHYAGVSCSMEQLMTLAAEKSVWIIEDAAQAVGAHWRGQPVGSRGHMSAFSFHESKNITSGGEGGVLCINDKSLVDRAEILCEKGTNRTRFFRGLVDKYTWVDKGSSYLMSDIQAAFLYAQLKRLQQVNDNRMATWQRYYHALLPLQESGSIRLPDVPAEAQHNAHTFHLRLRDEAQRNDLLGFLKDKGISAVFHYVPLHSSPFGKAHTVFRGKDVYTTTESARLVRLPLFYGMSGQQVSAVIEAVRRFFA